MSSTNTPWPIEISISTNRTASIGNVKVLIDGQVTYLLTAEQRDAALSALMHAEDTIERGYQ